ncbi:multicopper oxidase family protein [Amycolatopsis sp. H20-H5]|uniref:multicopper oxidase family protein n=1 Tax=Amycolatopsis sp. H20-H5 TaxID=3046309 RepID=UPI002DBF76DE|nr:multicopper oxidase family protein [Amycolatopsis sp. H20-H5]MEC3974397.1 multicopper oxidase family protein [Amycolatopsis sp. H20-H5]
MTSAADRTFRALSRRRFLALGGGLAATATLGACTSDSSPAPTRIGPASAKVAAAEQARKKVGASTVDVTLTALPADVDLGGVRVSTWAFDGRIPGKEIRAKRGDLVRVQVHNALPQETSLHWHGLALRNDMDGVPGLTQDAVKPGGSYKYEFTVPDAGTYWFHPHVGVQLDRGLYAPLIVDDPSEPGDYDQEVVIVLDDWLDGTGQTPDAVYQNLLQNGMGGMADMASMPKSALLGGDAGDVTYPHFLANGRVGNQPQTVVGKAGQRVRLRLINAGADTAFRVGVPGVTMTITHTDGFPVTARAADAVLLGMGERVDVVVELPSATTALLALPEGKVGFAQVVFKVGSGSSPDVSTLMADFLRRPVVMGTALAATEQVLLPAKNPDVTHELVLEGPTGKYTWTMNGKTYNPAEGLVVREGQRARLRFVNKTQMFHPMHLHGHTFQVRGQAGGGPRKDTAVVLPRQTLEVDFDADNPGQWLAHCHNVYHGEAGMMTVVSYVE